ncbi:MAG: hypothetical protein ACK5L5_04070 [Bacteroidales bacterium]
MKTFIISALFMIPSGAERPTHFTTTSQNFDKPNVSQHPLITHTGDYMEIDWGLKAM